MEALNNLENSITELSPEDYKKFRDWFFDYEQQKWDAKIEDDIRSNKMDALAGVALRDFKNL